MRMACLSWFRTGYQSSHYCFRWLNPDYALESWMGKFSCSIFRTMASIHERFFRGNDSFKTVFRACSEVHAPIAKHWDLRVFKVLFFHWLSPTCWKSLIKLGLKDCNRTCIVCLGDSPAANDCQRLQHAGLIEYPRAANIRCLKSYLIS